MRTFSSYGPIDTSLHYYAPRKELLDFGHGQLIGSNPEKGGHYITIWAPRQTGKTWAMNNILFKLSSDERFDVVKIELEILKTEKDVGNVLSYIEEHMARRLNNTIKNVNTLKKFQNMFLKERLEKPLILILDEFDALEEEAISAIVSAFRNIYNIRQSQTAKKTGEKDYLLHSVALIGVRSVVGIENQKGSPFNVQRSVHIPNLTFSEVEEMFRWHEKDSGQKVEQEVIERLYYETKGQPGLTCWFGELLTEGWDQFRVNKDMPMDMKLFEEAYEAAVSILPNNNILNIISKAKQFPYKNTLFKMFKTDDKIDFTYDDTKLNFLYMNGVIDREKADIKQNRKTKTHYFAKFASPFVQKRLFNYFSREIFDEMGVLHDPFEDIDDAVTEDSLNIRNVMKLFRKYLAKNRDWLLKNAPRRSDLRIYEAVFHFNLYMYLKGFLRNKGADVIPEFPTGNGKVDIIIRHAGKTYALELKSYRDKSFYKEALKHAALYGKQLELKEVYLIFFVEYVDDENRKKYEADYLDKASGIKVMPIFVETGN